MVVVQFGVEQMWIPCCFQRMGLHCNFGSSFGRIQASFELSGGLGSLRGFGSSCRLVVVTVADTAAATAQNPHYSPYKPDSQP